MLPSTLHSAGCSSYVIRRKASEAVAEVRSDMLLDHVLFHCCKQVADWLRLESSDPKNRDFCYIINAAYSISLTIACINKSSKND